MASVVIFTIYSWALLPLLTADQKSLPCVFPFLYDRVSYSSCIKNDAEELWCATTSDYDSDRQWKPCSTHEYGGNSNGRACTFPFAYKNKTYFTCTKEDAETGKFWCATTGSYDKDKQRSYCAETRLNANRIGPCVFPFIYRGQSYSTCTTAGASTGKLWCSLSSNYDVDPRWTYCDASKSLPCTFPFIFQKKTYSACTTEGAGDGIPWCATTADYDRDSQWKPCALTEYEGNSHGKACVFPFIYKSRTFFTCTNEGLATGRFWCATTGDYDKDKQWSYCADTRLDAKPKGPCVFPFTYKGQSYSTCTTAGESTGKLWCSFTSHYDEDAKRAYCDPSEPFPCVFPFIFQKKLFSACTTVGTGDGVLWCATTANYDRNSRWKPCAVTEYEGNSHGKACVFPFVYKNRTFSTCTNEDSGTRRFWCATTGDYDKDKQWSFCADTRA